MGIGPEFSRFLALIVPTIHILMIHQPEQQKREIWPENGKMANHRAHTIIQLKILSQRSPREHRILTFESIELMSTMFKHAQIRSNRFHNCN